MKTRNLIVKKLVNKYVELISKDCIAHYPNLGEALDLRDEVIEKIRIKFIKKEN